MMIDQGQDPAQEGIKLDLSLEAWAEGGTLGRLERATKIVDALAALASAKVGQPLADQMADILKLTIEDAIVQIRQDDAFYDQVKAALV